MPFRIRPVRCPWRPRAHDGRMATRADAVRREHAADTRRARRKRRPSLTALRIADLNRLFRARYGDQLPNDDAGRDDLALMAHHLVALPGNPADRIRQWALLRAPWIPAGELEAVIADAMRRPRRWSADRLAWRLRLIEDDRRALHITTIGAVDAGKASRAAARRARQRARKEAARRAAGVKPRAEYEAQSVARSKPWTALGMSRATWYRAGKPPAPP